MVADGGLTISATKSSSQPHVTLSNSVIGPSGNLGITDTVADVDFLHAGMAGGTGFDCGVDAGCTQNSDCSGGNTCQGPDAGLMHCLP